ncbi:RADIALIS 3 [Spatholobus suberectus]|nr:RADIALIS 3 [Spatholobus suberectus]
MNYGKSSVSPPHSPLKMSSRASDMVDLPKGLCGWSWKENKLFELALAVVDENHPERWEVVAAMVGGEKRAGDVQAHYVFLLEDLELIESGKLDHKLGVGEAQPCVLVDSTESLCLSDKDTSIRRNVFVLCST